MNAYVLIATECYNDGSDFFVIKAFLSEEKANDYLNELLKTKNDFILNTNQIESYNHFLNKHNKFKVDLNSYIDENLTQSVDTSIKSIIENIEKLKSINNKLMKEFELK